MDQYLTRKRAAVLAHLSNKCRRCGFSDCRALQIDHIDGGGGKELRCTAQWTYLNRVLAESFRFQLLCANCNWIKRSEKSEAKYRNQNIGQKARNIGHAPEQSGIFPEQQTGNAG